MYVCVIVEMYRYINGSAPKQVFVRFPRCKPLSRALCYKPLSRASV